MGWPADFEARRKKTLGVQLTSDLAAHLGGDLVIVPWRSATFSSIFTVDALTSFSFVG